MKNIFVVYLANTIGADPEISLGSIELKVSDAHVKKGREGESQVERVAWGSSAYIM